jgi:transposase
LNWFEYQCYLHCSLPRYVNSEKKITTIDIAFAPKSRSYTNKFSLQAILYLQRVRVQNTVANLLKTTPYIIRSIMEDAVEKALEYRGLNTDFKNVSLDEKAYKPGHGYATILIDSDKECVLNLLKDEKKKALRHFFLN